MYHKKFKVVAPMIYVDTRLYEGGHDDYYEAHTPSDLCWVCRIRHLLDSHKIPPIPSMVINGPALARGAVRHATGGSGSAPASWDESAGAGAVIAIRVSTRPERRRSPHSPRLRSGLAGPPAAKRGGALCAPKPAPGPAVSPRSALARARPGRPGPARQ
jgi:hypothetical protein